MNENVEVQNVPTQVAVPVEKPKKSKVKTFSLVSLIVMYVLVTASASLSANVVTNYYGEVVYLPLVAIALMLMFVPITIIFFRKKREFNIALIILTSVVIALSIALIVLSVVAYNNAFILESYWNNSLRKYVYYETICVADECWVIFAFAIVMVVLSALTLTFNLIAKRRKNKPAKVKAVKEVNEETQTNMSGLEAELTNAKRMFDNKIITEEEYNHIRTSIIAKYYK